MLSKRLPVGGHHVKRETNQVAARSVPTFTLTDALRVGPVLDGDKQTSFMLRPVRCLGSVSSATMHPRRNPADFLQ